MSTSTTLDNPNSFNFVIINTSINKLIGISVFGDEYFYSIKLKI